VYRCKRKPEREIGLDNERNLTLDTLGIDRDGTAGRNFSAATPQLFIIGITTQHPIEERL
jgi:hypothetical protein